MRERMSIAALAMVAGFYAGRAQETGGVMVIVMVSTVAFMAWFLNRRSRRATMADQAERIAWRDAARVVAERHDMHPMGYCAPHHRMDCVECFAQAVVRGEVG